MLIYLVTFLIVLLLAYFVFGKKKNLPPGPYGLPLLGYAPFLGKNPARTITDLKKKYGNVVRMNLGMRQVIILNNYEAIKEAFVKQGDKFSGRPYLFIPYTLFENKDIIFTDGPIWKKQRRFTMQTLRDFGVGRTSLETIIMEQVEQLTEHLMTKNGKAVQVNDLFFVAVMNVIWGISAGKTFDIHDDHIKSFKTAFDNANEVGQQSIINFFPILRHIIPGGLGYNKTKITTQKVKYFLAKEVENHVDNFNETNLRDVMDHYLAEIHSQKKEEQHILQFNKSHLVGTVFDLFTAGSDTISNTLAWAILYLVRRPEIQKKVQEELDKVISKDSYLSHSSKTLLPYTEATILETLRYSSLVPLAVPHRTMKDTTLMGYDIPENTTVFANLHAVHNDKEYWGDPEVFRPERFLNEFGKVIKHELLVPFSLGPRLCLGESMAKLELFLFLTTILRRFTFELNPDEPKPTEEARTAGIRVPHCFSCIIKSR